MSEGPQPQCLQKHKSEHQLLPSVLPPQVRRNQPNLPIADRFRQRFLDRLQPLLAKLLNRRRNLRIRFRRQPFWPELRIPGFNQIRNQGLDTADFPASNLRDLLEAAPFREQLQCFVRRARGLRVPIGAGSRALAESLQRGENLASVALNFFVAEAGNAATPKSRARLRRHSRRYSRSCASGTESVTVGRTSSAPGRSNDRFFATRRRRRDFGSSISSHGGTPAQLSQCSQRSHLGCSPK